MGATSVTGKGPGSAETPAHLNYNLDNIRKVYINDNGTFLSCVELIGDKWVLRNGSSLTSSGPIIISGSSVQCDVDGNPRGFKAYDFQCCRIDPSQVASGDHSFIAGGCENTASGTFSHAEGYANIARSDFSHAEGYLNQVNGAVGHGEGEFNRIGNIPRSCTFAGTTVTIPGGNFTNEFINNTQVYFFDLAGGSNNILFTAIRYSISGVIFNGSDTLFTISSAVGDRTSGMCVCGVFGQLSHVEGAFNVVNGQVSHCEGVFNTINGNFVETNYSHVEGYGNTVTNKLCHAEGKNNTASGYIAHVEGYQNTASGRFSHAEGDFSVASGWAGHAEGLYCFASGNYSHAEGYGSIASGYISHAGGERSVASNACQWARASGQFTSSVMPLGEAQFSFVVMRQSTTNASATEMFIKPDISSRLVIPTNNTSAVTITIIARQQGGSKNAAFKRYCIIKNDAGTTSLVGSVQTIGTDIGSNAGSPPAGWAVSVTADNINDSLKIEVTGEVATNIRWVAHVELVEVIYA